MLPKHASQAAAAHAQWHSVQRAPMLRRALHDHGAARIPTIQQQPLLLEHSAARAEASGRRPQLCLDRRSRSDHDPTRPQAWPRPHHPRCVPGTPLPFSSHALLTNPGPLLAALIPITAFALGTWQVQRLGWKTDLIAKFEDRLVRDPLPLPPHIDPSAIHDFDYRRVVATGRLRHDQEMLIGPRMRDGQDGYMVVTPLVRKDGSTILVNRGWISKQHRDQRTRPQGLPTGEVTIEGLLREPWKKNMFTPDNRPDKGEFYFPDVKQMAELTGAQPVWVEATMGTWTLLGCMAGGVIGVLTCSCRT